MILNHSQEGGGMRITVQVEIDEEPGFPGAFETSRESMTKMMEDWSDTLGRLLFALPVLALAADRERAQRVGDWFCEAMQEMDAVCNRVMGVGDGS